MPSSSRGVTCGWRLSNLGSFDPPDANPAINVSAHEFSFVVPSPSKRRTSGLAVRVLVLKKYTVPNIHLGKGISVSCGWYWDILLNLHITLPVAGHNAAPRRMRVSDQRASNA